MKRASTSFPVPDSPCRNTVVSVQATWVAFLNTCRHSGDCPTTRRGPDCPSRFSVRLRTIAERIAEMAMLGLLATHEQRHCRSSRKVLNLQIVLDWFGGEISPVAKCWTTDAGHARCGRRLATVSGFS